MFNNGSVRALTNLAKESKGASLPSLVNSEGGASLSYLGISPFYGVNQKKYEKVQSYHSKFRRFIRSINRINYLEYINFDFGRCSFITLTISNEFIRDLKSIKNAIQRVERYFNRLGIRYFIVVKEAGGRTARLHYHFIVFRSPYLVRSEVEKVWRIGSNIDIREIKDYEGGIVGGVAYLTYYLKKGFNLQFSRSFFKDKILDNKMYYLVKYDKDKKSVYVDNEFNCPVVSKKHYKEVKGLLHLSTDEVALRQWLQFKERHKEILYDLEYLKRLASEVKKA